MLQEDEHSQGVKSDCIQLSRLCSVMLKPFSRTHEAAQHTLPHTCETRAHCPHAHSAMQSSHIPKQQQPAVMLHGSHGHDYGSAYESSSIRGSKTPLQGRSEVRDRRCEPNSGARAC